MKRLMILAALAALTGCIDDDRTRYDVNTVTCKDGTTFVHVDASMSNHGAVWVYRAGYRIAALPPTEECRVVRSVP